MNVFSVLVAFAGLLQYHKQLVPGVLLLVTEELFSFSTDVFIQDNVVFNSG